MDSETKWTPKCPSFAKADLETIIAEDPALEEVLSLCPIENNIGGSITEEFFFSHLFACKEAVDKLIETLNGALKSAEHNHLSILVHGYPGTGKSTFLRRFALRHKDDYCLQTIDFSNAKNTTTGMQTLLHRYFRKNLHSCPHLLRAMQEVHQNLREYEGEISEGLETLLAETKSDTLEFRMKELVRACGFADLMHLLVLRMHASNSDGKKIVVLFDNLDQIEVEFLTTELKEKMLEFIDRAAKFYNTRSTMGRTFRFRRNVRFVFSLREANYQVMRAHLLDRWAMSFMPFAFDVDMTWESIGVRVSLAKALYEENVENQATLERLDEIRTIVLSHAYENIHDTTDTEVRDLAIYGDYFRFGIAPLFNFDNRKLAGVLQRVAKQQSNLQPRVAAPAEGGVRWEKRFRYCLGGSIVHHLSKHLLTRDFGRPIFDPAVLESQPVAQHLGSVKENYAKGHCLLLRLMLTVVLNQSAFKHTTFKCPDDGACSLRVLLNTLLPYYSLRDIMQCIAESFLFHQRGWVSLCLVHNYRIVDSSDLEKEIELIEQEWNNTDSAPEEGLGREAAHRLGDVRVSITPAGFVFLKHILCHFEFYSRVANNDPIFALGFKKDEQGEFLFERTLDRTFRLVEHHCKLMERFYDSTIGLPPEAYVRSAMVFKHLGKFNAPKADAGRMHTVRLVNSMVNYLDCFRLLMINSDWSQDEEIDETTDIVKANRSLVKWINKFSKLHEACRDPEAGVYRKKHLEAIERIRRRPKDFTTVIVHQGDPREARGSA